MYVIKGKGGSSIIVLDLEFNSGWFSVNLEEILQIGAVKVERLGGPIRDTFNAYIRPVIHKRLSPVAKFLPELETCKASSLTFPEVFRAFMDWCGEETEFAEWGRNDFRVLYRNVAHWGLKGKLPERYYDLQTAFSRTVGMVNTLPLSCAADYCRVPDTFTFHDALNDAMYTALVGGYIDRAALESSLCQLSDRETNPAITPKQPKKNQQRSGPFDTRDQALSSLQSRRARCPECGATVCVNEWATADGSVFYARLRCGSHDRFIRRLKLIVMPDGHFWTYGDTLACTPDNLRLLNEAKDHHRHPCQSQGPRRRKRRPRRKK